MSIYLDGALQGGGGIATIADVTVSGGAVTTLSTGAISLDNNKWYNIYAPVFGAGSVTKISLYVNGDATDSNYANTYSGWEFGTNLDYSDNDLFAPYISIASGQGGYIVGKIMCDGTTVYMSTRIHRKAGSAVIRSRLDDATIAKTSITELQLTADAASGLANDSRIIITEAY